MKRFTILVGLLALGTVLAATASAAPKHFLVVSVTKGFRHSSIPLGNETLSALARRSGAFTVEFAEVNPNDAQYKGPEGKTDKAKVDAAITAVLAEKMSPEALKKYDGVIFNSTTGDLPIPDVDAFLKWLESGKAFVGVHAASDTFRGHKPLHPFIQMVGAEFRSHPPGLYEVDIINHDPDHPACQHLPPRWRITDEIYLLNGYEPAKVSQLLSLDKHPSEKTPGEFPLAWCKTYGKAKVFYTALGHDEKVWQRPDFQEHVLGGILWSIGEKKPKVAP